MPVNVILTNDNSNTLTDTGTPYGYIIRIYFTLRKD